MSETSAPPIDVGRIVGASFRIYQRRWRPHLGVAVVCQLPALIPTLVLVSLLIEATVDILQQRSVEALLPAAGLLVALLLVSFCSAFLFILMSAVACQLVSDWLERRQVSLSAAYAFALRRFWRLAGAMLAGFVVVLLGLIAIAVFLALFYIGFLVVFQIDIASDPRVFWMTFAIMGIAACAAAVILVDAMVRWSVFVQAVMIEGHGPLTALKRSAQLVRGNWRRTAGAMALFIVVPLILMSLLASALNLLFTPMVVVGMLSGQTTNSIAIAIAQVLLSPIPAIGITVLFYRLRDGADTWTRIDARVHEESAP